MERCGLIWTRDWTAELDARLRLCAGAISHGLSRELECLQLREQLTQQQDQLRTLIHQLRNPLAALRTYAQLLLRRLEADSQHRPLVEGVLTEQNQLGLYIDALAGLEGPTLPAGTDPSAPLLLPPGSAESNITLKERLVPLIERRKPWPISGTAGPVLIIGPRGPNRPGRRSGG